MVQSVYRFTKNMEVCYVCHELTNERSNCKCKANIHDACLLLTAASTQSTTCCICKENVAGLLASKRRQRLTPSGWLCATLAFMTAAFCVMALLCVAAAAESRTLYWFRIYLASSIALVAVGMLASEASGILRDAVLWTPGETYTLTR